MRARQRRGDGSPARAALGRLSPGRLRGRSVRDEHPRGRERGAASSRRARPASRSAAARARSRPETGPPWSATPEAALAHTSPASTGDALPLARARAVRRCHRPAARESRAWSLATTRAQAVEADVRAAAAACSNGLDDDGDGAIDHPADPGCASPGDVSERALGNPSLPCDDGVDSADTDVLADHPADRGCRDRAGQPRTRSARTAPTTTAAGRRLRRRSLGGQPDGRHRPGVHDGVERPEATPPPPGCGVGPELVLLAPLLGGDGVGGVSSAEGRARAGAEVKRSSNGWHGPRSDPTVP